MDCFLRKGESRKMFNEIKHAKFEQKDSIMQKNTWSITLIRILLA